MNRDQRLRRPRDFDAAYRSGRVEGDRLLVVRVRPNDLPQTRAGFVAAKAVGGAVVRNRVKRRLRAAISSLELRPGLDIVVSARKTAADAAYSDLARSLRTLLQRSGAIATEA
jgi:ribonuclease P protein component